MPAGPCPKVRLFIRAKERAKDRTKGRAKNSPAGSPKPADLRMAGVPAVLPFALNLMARTQGQVPASALAP